MSGLLHQLLSADPRAVEDCSAFVSEGDEVLLVDSGVHLLGSRNSILAAHARDGCKFRLFALASDVIARGLQCQAEQLSVTLVDDGQWLDHVCASQQVLSWK